MPAVTMHPRADRILNYSFTQSRYGFPHIIRTNPATHTYKEWVVEQRQNMTLTLVLRNERGEVGTEKDIVRRGDELEFEAHLIDSRTKRTLSTADLVDDLKKPVTTLFNSPQLDSGGEDRLLGVMTDGDVSFVTMFNFSCQHLKPGIPKGAVRLRVRPTAPALRNDPNLQLETCDFTVKSKITKQQRPTTQEYSRGRGRRRGIQPTAARRQPHLSARAGRERGKRVYDTRITLDHVRKSRSATSCVAGGARSSCNSPRFTERLVEARAAVAVAAAADQPSHCCDHSSRCAAPRVVN